MQLRVAMSAAAALCLAGTAMGQQLKISQIYGGGGNTGAPYNRDFVEIFNAGAAPVDVTGWSIQYASATGTTWSKTDLTGAIIQPGGYYLAQMTLTGTVGSPLPTPDHTVSTAISMSATVGKVALVSNTTALSGACPSGSQIVDFVGFGATANCFEGAAATAAPSNTTAVLRDENGCEDTNDNAANFTVGAPAPRNSAAPANVCPQPPGADLGVAFTTGPAQVLPGAGVDYSLLVSNFGPDLATGVTLTIPVPGNVTFVSSTPPNTPSGGVLTFNLADIALAGSTPVSVSFIADAGPTVALTATVAGSAADPVASNNTDSFATLIYTQANAKLVAGVDDPAAPVVAVDVTSGAMETLWTGALRALASDDGNRRFYYSTGTQLWAVPYDAPRTPVQVGTFHGAVTSISAGLAFDSIRNRLIGTGTAGEIYAIDPATATATLLRDLTVGDLQGVDFDPVRDRIVCTNDSTSMTPPMAGRGLYIIDPLGTEVTLVAGYPIKTGSTLDTDIDACAYGEGVIYPVADERLWFYRYSESSMAYQTPFETPFGTDQVFSGATYTRELFTPSPGANLSTSIAAPATCAVAQGQTLTYTVTVHNYGPDAAGTGALTAPIPAGTTFQSSVPSLTPVGGELVLDITGLAAGADATLTVNVTADLAGGVTMTASATSSTADAFPANNSASAATQIAGVPPTSAVIEGIWSTLAGSNEVPEFPGIFFDDAVDADRPVRSYSGGYWVMTANTTDVATQDDMLLRGQGDTFNVQVQEGITPLQTAEPVGLLDLVYGVNDSGAFAFGTNLDGDTLIDEVIVKSSALGLEIVAREGSAVPSLPGSVYGTTSNGGHIQSDGTVSFQSSVNAVTTTDGWFTDDGNVLIAQEGVTIPANQGGGLTDTYRQLDSGSVIGQGIYFSADGAHYCGRGFVGAADADDGVVVVDGSVVLQEGYVVPGSSFASPISSAGALMNYMEPHGDWFAYGSNVDGQDWAVRNGAVLAARGDEIFPGAAVFWDDAAYAQGFFLATGNRFGDYVIGGLSTPGDALSDAVIVYNRTRVVLRENDPVDLDGDGMFDDDAYIHVFRDDYGWLGEDGYLYMAVRLRNGAGICSGAPADIGQGLVRVKVFCPADWNRDGTVNSTDVSAFLTTWLASVQGGTVRSDFNADAVTNSSDISAFLTAWLAAVQGGC